MLILDDNGNLFDDRRKGDRRKVNEVVIVDRRSNERRDSSKNVKHEVQENENEQNI